MKYSIFHVQGGLGKHVASTAVARTIKNNHPDRKLIVVCAYPDVFTNLDFVDRVYTIGGTSYFYQNYIKDQDSVIFHHEPYFTTDHIHQRLPLVQTWCKMYGIEYKGETPVVKLNKLQQDLSRKYWIRGTKPIMVLHTNGGLMTTDAKAYSWTRDMPENIGQALVDHYRKDYTIYQVTKLNSPKLKGAHHVFATQQQYLSTMELFSLLLHSQKNILIDSCLQHTAAALKRPSVVLWNGTSPKVFGYDIHNNITPTTTFPEGNINSYLYDYSFNGIIHECPYDNIEQVFNIQKI